MATALIALGGAASAQVSPACKTAERLIDNAMRDAAYEQFGVSGIALPNSDRYLRLLAAQSQIGNQLQLMAMHKCTPPESIDVGVYAKAAIDCALAKEPADRTAKCARQQWARSGEPAKQ